MEAFDAIAQREQNRSPGLKQSESNFKLNISDGKNGFSKKFYEYKLMNISLKYVLLF